MLTDVGKPVCLLYGTNVAVIEEFHLKWHLETKHQEKPDCRLQKVSEEMAKPGRPLTEGEFVKSCMLKVCDVLCPDKMQM